ncbi:MAG: AAA family ATPase [Coriobacteriia bacterium]|nr:AAA family ATPase [Coriobacteriia bacterium]
MRIQRIKIENFRQWQSLDLDLGDERSDVTIVVGSNGAGKTNLLNSIIWCLYGREDYYSRDMDACPLVSQASLDSADEGALLVCSVTVELGFANGGWAEITRAQEFVKSGKTAQRHQAELKVLTRKSADKGCVSEANPEHWIERTVPARLEPYFLFDGERLDNFFKNAEAQKVEDAVLQIAQIDLLRRLIDHLEKVSSKLYSKAARAGGGGDAEIQASRLDDTRARLEKKIEEIAQYRAAISTHDDVVRMLESKVGDIAAVAQDVRKRQELQSQFNQIGASVEESWAELHKWSGKSAPGILAFEALQGLRSTIDAARAERRLPPPVAPDILEELLGKFECVCGNPLTKGSDGRKRIEELLAEYEHIGQLGDVLLSLEPGMRAVLAGTSASPQTAESIMKRIDDWETRAQNVGQELEVLNGRLAGNEDSQVQQIEQELRRARTELERARLELAKAEIRAEEFRETISEIEKDLGRLKSQDAKLAGLIKEAQFAKRCLAVARGTYDELTTEVRMKVAKSLDENFRSMIWTKDLVESVTINENYGVSVTNSRGFEILPVLSAGQRECLALAFSLALSEVSGYEFPMVIDTPMGRLNRDVQTFVAQVFAETTKAADGHGPHQLMMLMTDTEYTKDVARVFATRNPTVFKINFDSKQTVSTLEGVR